MHIAKTKRRQIDQLADIISQSGIVIFATAVIPAVLDSFDPYKVLLGLAVSLISG